MRENKIFNVLFAGMGTCLLMVAGWIGSSVAHIPTIEQKLDDFMIVANKTLGDHGVELGLHSVMINENRSVIAQHDIRIKQLEKDKKK